MLSPKLEQRDGKTYVFDPIRKKQIVLTPEEWVRQCILLHVVHQKNYPASSISVEKQIKVGKRLRRYDVLVYHRENPWLLLECKEENTPINASVLQQLLAYVSVISVQFIAISNGREIHCYDVCAQQWTTQFPDYPKG